MDKLGNDFKYREMIVTGDLLYRQVSSDTVFGDSDTLYLFGDNLLSRGRLGQALVRDATNSYGIITKRLPSTDDHAYFSDKDNLVFNSLIILNLREITHLIEIHGYKKIYIPENGIGTGLAKLNERSPKIFKTLSYWLHYFFGFHNPGWDGTRK